MVGVNFRAAVAVAIMLPTGATARLSFSSSFLDFGGNRELEVTGDSCHGCDCFTCDSVSKKDDGTLDVKIGHCKDGSISWMCCVGTDGKERNCKLASCAGTQEGSTCHGIGLGEGLMINVAKETVDFTINTYDGKTAGDADVQTAVCGADGNQEGVCDQNGATAHCLKTFSLMTDCGFNPINEGTAGESEPDPEPAPENEGKVCPTDVEPCWDGSFVSRVLPDCDFEACPENPNPPEPEATGGDDGGSGGGGGSGGDEGGDDREPNAPRGSYGDPHVKVWSGETFDFHGSCDLVLMDNPSFHDGLGMSIHIRTKIVTWWSFIESAVVRIGNESIEVSGGKEPKYYLNGVEGEHNGKTSFLFSELGLKVVVKQATNHQIKVRIDLLHSDAIGVETFKEFVRVNFRNTDPKWGNFAGSRGLMGDYPTGVRLGRDGKTVFTDMNAYGQEWQVRDSEPMLFHNVDGPQHPTKCLMPGEATAEQKRRRLGLAKISREAAVAACSGVSGDDHESCVFDVLATQDLDMAASY